MILRSRQTRPLEFVVLSRHTKMGRKKKPLPVPINSITCTSKKDEARCGTPTSPLLFLSSVMEQLKLVMLTEQAWMDRPSRVQGHGFSLSIDQRWEKDLEEGPIFLLPLPIPGTPSILKYTQHSALVDRFSRSSSLQYALMLFHSCAFSTLYIHRSIHLSTVSTFAHEIH